MVEPEGEKILTGRASAPHPFLVTAGKYAAALSSEGTRARVASRPDECPIFDALAAADRQRILARMEADLELFKAVWAEGSPIKDSKRFLWRFLAQSGLTPCADIFDKIEDDDVVCVYDLSNRQIFQNLRFFDFVSITLEQLFCSSWYDYSSRPPEIEKILFEEGLQLLSGQVRHTVQPSAPEHLIEEKNTADLLKVRILVKWGSPIFLKGAPAGMIIVNRCALESGG